MTCNTVILEGGIRAIICTRDRPRRLRCGHCGRRADLLCDFPRPKRRSGTCDKPLCRYCAIAVGPDRHHCPGHQLELPL